MNELIDFRILWPVAVLVLLVAWLIILQLQQNRLWQQYRRLMTGSQGQDLEAILNAHLSQVQEAAAQIRELQRLARQLEKAARHSLQHLGVVRFNPFSDTGGNQSFAIALVDGHGNGVVLSSLHGRESTRIFAKPLRRWDSEYSLTDEEKEAIARAFQQQS